MDKDLLHFYSQHYNKNLQYYGTRENYDILTSFFLARPNFDILAKLSPETKINFVLNNKIFLSSKFLKEQQKFLDNLNNTDLKILTHIQDINDNSLSPRNENLSYTQFKNRIIEIFNLAPKLDREVIVYRGFQVEDHPIVNNIKNLTSGKEIIIPKFMSTTFNVKVVDMFSDEHRNGMIIKLKSGTKCIFVELLRLGYLLELVIAPARYKFIKNYENRNRFFYVLEFIEHVDLE